MVIREQKCHPPQLPSPILSREVLLQKLEAALLPSPTRSSTTCKLILLRAPAGYGKTTLLADFARRSRLSILWYFLDQTDGEFSQFLDTFTMLLCQAAPELKTALPPQFVREVVIASQSEDHMARGRSFAHYTALLDDHLSRLSHPLILCICNYQEVSTQETHHAFLNHLLRTMPSHFTLIIESRSIPNLELSSLVARRQILGIGSNLLGFSPQDVSNYVHLLGLPLTFEDTEKLANDYEGWISGLLLGTLLGDPTGSSSISIGQQALLAYLTAEVFTHEAQAYNFLQDTAFLSQLSAPLCDSILQRDDAATFLAHIEHQGLFLERVHRPSGHHVSTDSGSTFPSQTMYALHPVLRKVLTDELERSDPERMDMLRQRAAKFFQSQEEYEQAIMNAIATKAYSLAVEIMEQAACPRSGESVPSMPPAAFTQWLESLPRGLWEQSPRLLLMQATISITHQNYLQAAPLLEQALQAINRAPTLLEESTTLNVEILLAQSAIVFHEGRYSNAQQLCEDTLQLLAADQVEWRIPALARLGMSQVLLGEYVKGLSSLHQALHLSGHASATHETALLHSSLANTYTLLSNTALSEHHRARAIALYERLNDTQGVINSRIWLAILQQNTGRLGEANVLLQNVLEQARASGFTDSSAYALFNLGTNALDQSDLAKALEYFDEGLQLARKIGDQRLVNQYLCELSMAYLLLQDLTTAQLLLAQTTVTSSRITDQLGYESLGFELISCTVLLYNHEFANAAQRLSAFESLAKQAQRKRLQIEGLVRLAICHYSLNQPDEMEVAMTKVVHLVTHGAFEHVPIIEFQRFPNFWHAVKQLPNTACLDVWRSNSSPEQEEPLEHVIDAVQELHVSLPSSARLQICALGEPSVLVDGVPITRWHLAKSLELCFFLLDCQRRIHRKKIIEALWSEDEEYADQTVRSVFHYLRKALGKDCLDSQGGMYMLDLHKVYGEQIWYDVAIFQQHQIQVRQTLEEEDQAIAENHLRAMIDLYRGDYVQSFYSDWCVPRREALRTQCLDVYRELAHLLWRQERWEDSLVCWQQLVALAPYDEEAHEGTMRCYLRLGKRGLAVQQYHRCKEVLQRELALLPGTPLQKLYQRITNNA